MGEIFDFDDEKDEDDDTVKILYKHTRLKIIIVLAIFIIGGIIGWGLRTKWYKAFEEKPKPTVDYLSGKLEDIGNLATQQITYTARLPVDEGVIPFINKKGFVMEYTATLKAGIEFSKMKIRVTDDKVKVTIPHAAVIGTAELDSDSITFHDEKKAIFNWTTKDDITDAIAEAKKDIDENPSINISLLLERADENAEELIHTVLDDSVGDREVVVAYK